MRAIIEDRMENGAYANIFNFCSRLDSSSVNKTVLESLIASGAMDELEGSRAQKWAVIEQALAFSSSEQRDRKKGQTSLFDLIADDDDNQDYYPTLPAIEPWTYLHQLDMEKAVLGFYMSGHPLFEYRAMLKYISTADSISGKAKSGEMLVVGIVSNISKKKDNRGKSMAFIEMEDLMGKFEVPLFNRDYDSYLEQMQVGRVFLVYGSKSQFNGNDDGMLRVMPKAMIPFENLDSELSGTLKIRMNQSQIKKGLLLELARQIKRSKGKFRLQTELQGKDEDYFTLETENGLFPDNAILTWLEGQKLEFSLECKVNNDKEY